MKKQRLSAKNRRAAILAAVAPLFARYGFKGVTTSQLSDAAGVSEALLYRHFPDKRTLYAAANRHPPAQSPFADIAPTDLPPSTRRLALSMHRLAERFTSPGHETFGRQLCLSLVDDGLLAQSRLTQIADALFPTLLEDLQEAYASGDSDLPPAGHTELWLAQHLLLGLQLHALPERPPLDYHTPRFELLRRCVCFTLRGFGIRQAVIDKVYRPELLAHPASPDH